jgi:hypothetical protein
MRRFIKQISFVLLAILALLIVLDILYTWSLSETPVYGIGKDEKVDWIIAGDSRTISLRSNYVSHVSGKKVLNIAAPFFSLDNNIEILDYFFKNGNRVDRVLLQVDQKFGSRRGVRREYEYMPHVIRQKGILSPRIPFVYYAENNKNIRPTHILRVLKGIVTGDRPVEKLADTANFKVTWFVYNPKLMQDHSQEEFRIEDLKRLREYLRDKGVKELVLYSPPYLPDWIRTQSDSASFKSKVREAGFRYYDFSNIYPDTSYFKDHLHIQNRRDYEYGRLISSSVLNQP